MSLIDLAQGAPRGTLLARVFGRASARVANAEDVASPATPPIIAERSVPGTGRGQSSEPRLYLDARRQIKRRAWGYAQRTLEEASRVEADGAATLDLLSVRAIRRALRRLSRWPSDVDSHLDLGRAYFDLDLGEDALAEFHLVQRLAPGRYEGYALASLEYLYRGDYGIAVSTWARALALHPELPPLDEVMGKLPV